MKIRVLIGILVVAGIVGSLGRVADASIVLNYTFNGKGEARLVGVESSLAHAIRMSIEGGEGLLAVLVGDQIAADGSWLPVLRVRPINSSTADAAVAGKAYLTFSFQTGQESGVAIRTLEFDISKPTGSGEFGCLVQSSADGFRNGSPVLLLDTVATKNSDSIHYCVDLSGTQFQNLAEVDFRVYFYSSESSEPLEFDGIRLNGEVIVAPEPGSSVVWLMILTAVFCLGAVAWTARRNRAVLSYAGTGHLRMPASRRTNQPWPKQAREAILEIIDRGRMS